MKLHLFILVVLLGALLAQAGPGPCVGCTLVVGMIEKIALEKGVTLKEAGNLWCDALGNKVPLIGGICAGIADYLAPLLEPDFGQQTPDWTCKNTLNTCPVSGASCVLWPDAITFLDGQQPILSGLQNSIPDYTFDATKPELTYFFDWAAQALTRWVEPTPEFTEIDPQDIYHKLHRYFRNVSPSILKLSSFTKFDNQFEKLGISQLGAWHHYPIVDDDKDSFSTFAKLRGTDWRGSDCDDKDANVYPGRIDTSTTKDGNCNFIHGVDKTSGKSYEELFCKPVKQYGIAVLGDSSQAHFSIPPHWLSPKNIAVGTYDNLLEIVMNELDFPACSTVTGFDKASCPTFSPATAPPPFESIYMRNRKRNLCSTNDYQNISVNGARSSSMKPGGIVDSLARKKKSDHPMIVFINLIGNDVCNKNSDTSSMSQPAVYRGDMLLTLNYLDEILPTGSQVLLGSLVDGTILFDTMSQRKHDLGFKYVDFYNYLNCHNTSPCAGWMNADASIRRATTDHAMKLSHELETIVAQHNNFESFKVHYLPLHQFFSAAATAYPRPAELIEPNDGFHPSSVAQMLLADATWGYMEQVLGIQIPSNPNNVHILDVFGDLPYN